MVQIGLDYITCKVNEINGRRAIVIDQFDRTMTVRIDVRRGKGPLPEVGETWLIDRTLGPWTFAACLNPKRIEITGSTDNNPALKSLIAALERMGWIKDLTTDDQLRAEHLHTHVIPSASTGTGGDPSHTHTIPSRTSQTDSPSD